MKIKGKEINGMTQNKILIEVLEDIKKREERKKKRKVHGGRRKG
jgi:hypothetical protein